MKPIWLSAVLILHLCICLLEVKAQGRDQTRIPGSNGSSVVQATVALIRGSGIFPNDHQLLRRIAWVESKDGTHSQTYRQGYHGGIWQVDLIGFQDTQNTTSHPRLVSKFSQIRRRLGIDWRTVQWEDLRKPLYSGLAARLLLSNKQESIPLASNVTGQASYWKRHYNTKRGAGTEEKFIQDVRALTGECQIRGIDLIFVLDSSGSVGSSNFRRVINFAGNLVRQLEIGPSNTRVGLIRFASSASALFHLNTYQSKSNLLQAISAVRYISGGTNTAAALNTLLREFRTVYGARPLQEGIPRVTIVVTDGHSNSPTATIAAANNIHASNIKAYAVGVGSSILSTELNAIASDPDSQYVRRISTFNVNELNELQESLNSEACQTSVIAEIAEPFISTIEQNQVAFFQFILPEEGLTLRLEVRIGLVVLFASNKIQNPNEAFHDWKLETNSSADVYISLEGITKQQVQQFVNTTIFISIKGQSGVNNFTLNSTSGDTTGLQNVVIDAVQSTAFAGASYTLNCTVMSDPRPIIEWTGPNGNPVNSTDSIIVDEPVYDGNETYVSLRFLALRTSQGGRYTCQSVLNSPASVKTATKDIVVTVPTPRVRITRTPSTGVYTPTLLNLTCITVLNPEVDTPVTVTHTWRGPSGSISRYSSRPRVSNVTQAGHLYWSSIFFSSGMRASDSGTYTCTSSASSSSSYIVTSGSVVASTSVTVALKVVIDISYTPPEEGYQPPYYRAASAVTLTCRAVGTIGRTSYRWRSTCSSCFVSSYSSYSYSYSWHSITQSLLRSRDAGTHTCSAYDTSQRISGSASTVMNIVGAGIYASSSPLYSSRSLPNNSIITSNTRYYSRYSSGTRMGFYCCSNSTTSGSTGTFIGLNGNSYSGTISVQRYSSSHSYAGCIRLYLYKSYRSYSQNYLSSSEQGIYTCRMPDSAGRNINVSIGIYSQGYITAPHVTSLRRTSSTTNLTLTCTSTNSPATYVTWMKDGDTLDIDGVKYKTYQTVTDRQNSTYQNTLVVDDVIENITGTYTCNVTNTFGSSSNILTVRGIRVSSIQTPITIGDTVSIVCSTDLDVETIKWIRDGVTVAMSNSSNQSLTLLLDSVSADYHNTQYTCRVISLYGVLEETVDIIVRIPQAWATVQISTPPDDSAIVGREFVMTCTVTVVRGLTVIPRVVWIGPEGNLTATKNITMGYEQTSGLVTTRSLTLHSLQSSERGRYSCMAAISISGLKTRSGYKELIVLSQALIQLKFGPSQHCVQWMNPQSSVANWIDRAVKKALTAAIRERCGCDFQSSSIKSGEFSCQSTTTHVVYRTTINSDTHTAPQILNFIEDWIKNEGAFLVGYFRLRVVPECPLQIQSFYQPECTNIESTSKRNSTMISRKVP